MIAVALRMPGDLAAYPQAPTYLCTYSILEPALEALARGPVWQSDPAPAGCQSAFRVCTRWGMARRWRPSRQRLS